MTNSVALVEKVADKVITLTPPPPLDENQGHQMVWWSMGSVALVADNGILSLQNPPWVNTRPPPPGNHNTSSSQSPVLLTQANAGNFVEVTAQCGHQMTTCSLAVPSPLCHNTPSHCNLFSAGFWVLGLQARCNCPAR
jgi:hypothetical protein